MKNLFDRARLFFSKDKEFRSALYQIMGFCPHNIDLYRTAFAHKSHEYRSKKTGNKPLNNERLEFLGDAVLETVVSHIVYRKYPNKREGFLTNTRSKIVSRESLGKLAKELGIDRLIQSQTHGRTHNSYLEGNSFEALMGAIYLDRGFRYAFQFIEKRIIGAVLDLDTVANKEVNFKSKLLEWKQKNRIHLDFVDNISNNSNSTSPSFHTTVVIEGIPAGEGKGFSKKESHQAAAKDALTQMRRDADFLDAMFRAKEKRTAMGAEEFFALPHISEIDEQIAKERSGAKNERNSNRSERNERKNERKNEKAERNERKSNSDNAEREERNQRKNENAAREEKRNERKSDKEERKNERDNSKLNRKERKNAYEEQQNQRSERKSEREERATQPVIQEERSEQKAATCEQKSNKHAVVQQKSEVKVEAPQQATEKPTEKVAKVVTALTETKVEAEKNAHTLSTEKPRAKQVVKPTPNPTTEATAEEVVATPAVDQSKEKVQKQEETPTLITVEFVDLPEEKQQNPIVEPQAVATEPVAETPKAPLEDLQQELDQWTEAADHACEITPTDTPISTEEIRSFTTEQSTNSVEEAPVAPQRTEHEEVNAVPTPEKEEVVPEMPNHLANTTEAVPQNFRDAVAPSPELKEEAVATVLTEEPTKEPTVAVEAVTQEPTEHSEEHTAAENKEATNATEEPAPRVRTEQEKKRARRQNKRQNAADFTNTTLPPAEQSHRAQKAERKLQEQAEKRKEEARQRQVKKVQQELAETFQLDVDIDDFMVVDTTPSSETSASKANEANATKANKAAKTSIPEEKRKNNRSRSGRRGGNNRRRGGNRSNTAKGESKEGGKSAPTAAHNSQEA
jgi:ribonuclease III